MKARGPGASDRYRRRIGARASGVDLFEADGLAPVMTQDSPATGDADVVHPVRVLAEHRHQVELALVLAMTSGNEITRRRSLADGDTRRRGRSLGPAETAWRAPRGSSDSPLEPILIR